MTLADGRDLVCSSLAGWCWGHGGAWMRVALALGWSSATQWLELLIPMRIYWDLKLWCWLQSTVSGWSSNSSFGSTVLFSESVKQGLLRRRRLKRWTGCFIIPGCLWRREKDQTSGWRLFPKQQLALGSPLPGAGQTVQDQDSVWTHVSCGASRKPQAEDTWLTTKRTKSNTFDFHARQDVFTSLWLASAWVELSTAPHQIFLSNHPSIHSNCESTKIWWTCVCIVKLVHSDIFILVLWVKSMCS